MKYFESNFMNDFSVIPISLSKLKKKKKDANLLHIGTWQLQTQTIPEVWNFVLAINATMRVAPGNVILQKCWTISCKVMNKTM